MNGPRDLTSSMKACQSTHREQECFSGGEGFATQVGSINAET